jgi:MFS-type transporter involved in bile tolerance (Atg22 family)
MSRWIPITVVLAAAVSEAFGLGQLPFYLLLVAVPIVAASALTAFGELLDRRFEPAESLQAILSCVALLMLVAGAAAGSTAFAISACLAAFALQALLGSGPSSGAPRSKSI